LEVKILKKRKEIKKKGKERKKKSSEGVLTSNRNLLWWRSGRSRDKVYTGEGHGRGPNTRGLQKKGSGARREPINKPPL